MNLNPFKNTYKIIEKSSFNSEKNYMIRYGNLFYRVYLAKDGGEWVFEEHGDLFSSLNNTKAAIQCHAEKLLKKRMEKVFKKTIGYI